MPEKTVNRKFIKPSSQTLPCASRQRRGPCWTGAAAAKTVLIRSPRAVKLADVSLAALAASPSVHALHFIMSSSGGHGLKRKVDNLVDFLNPRSSKTSRPSSSQPIASAAPQSSGASGIAASTYPPARPSTASAPPPPLAQATESWWSTHRTEIVAGVRQVLGMTKEALEGLPVYGPAAAVSTLEKVLEIFQVRVVSTLADSEVLRGRIPGEMEQRRGSERAECYSKTCGRHRIQIRRLRPVEGGWVSNP
jgi:hypothetical protein